MSAAAFSKSARSIDSAKVVRNILRIDTILGAFHLAGIRRGRGKNSFPKPKV
jgi:hypothetical protein